MSLQPKPPSSTNTANAILLVLLGFVSGVAVSAIAALRYVGQLRSMSLTSDHVAPAPVPVPMKGAAPEPLPTPTVPDMAVALPHSEVQPRVAPAHVPIPKPVIERVAPLPRLKRTRVSIVQRLLYKYSWAIVPIVLITIFNINAHLRYNIFDGYDMPQHFENTFYLIKEGAMPQPPINRGTYQGFQAPLFYILAAWYSNIAENFYPNSFQGYMGVGLTILSTCWLLLMTWFIQHAMPRTPGWWKATVLCTGVLFPINIITTTMFNNDGMVNVLLLLATLVLWTLARLRKPLEAKLWLRAAAIAGLAICTKGSAGLFLPMYGGLGVLYIIKYFPKREYRKIALIVRNVALGLPLMLIPFVIVGIHSARYSNSAFILTDSLARDSAFGKVGIRYFTTFDNSIFDSPYRPAGLFSFWSMEYATLHNDYYNHWTVKEYETLPPALLQDVGWNRKIPIWHYEAAVLLQKLAIPITLIIVLGSAVPAYFIVRRFRRTINSGGAVMGMTALATQAAQIGFFFQYDNALVIQARYSSFAFPLLFAWGAWILWRIRKRQLLNPPIFIGICTVCMVAYAVVAYFLMWLPTF